MNVEDSIQSENQKYNFSLSDLIQVNTMDEVHHNDFPANQVAEPEVEYWVHQNDDHKSTFDVSKTINPYIENFNKSDINRLKVIVASTLNNYKNILELSPDNVLSLIEDFVSLTVVINEKLMKSYADINKVLRNSCTSEKNLPDLSEKTFFELLNDDNLRTTVFSKNLLKGEEKEMLKKIMKKSTSHYQEVKNGYMRLRALQVIKDNYHSHLFFDKMEELEKNCLQIIAKVKIDDVKRGVDYLTPVGRYKIFEKLTKKPEDEDEARTKRDDAIKILEKELVLRYGYTLNEFHNSNEAFLNAYDAWQRRSNV